MVGCDAVSFVLGRIGGWVGGWKRVPFFAFPCHGKHRNVHRGVETFEKVGG